MTPDTRGGRVGLRANPYSISISVITETAKFDGACR